MKRSGWIERRTPLKRGKPPARSIKPINRGKPPRRVSAKRRKQLEGYPEVRLAVIRRDGPCVLGKLDALACARNIVASNGYDVADSHHVVGRNGDRLTDYRRMVALHRPCHEFVHAHQKEWRPRLLAYLGTIHANG